MSFRYICKKINNFAIHTLSNDDLSVSVAPELGGRVVSIFDRASGREWLDGWRPAGKRRVWQPADPTDFSTGPGAGIDECLPTVLPCRFGRKAMPDHGELWNRPAEFDEDLAQIGALACRWKLKSLPLEFHRHIAIGKNTLAFNYRIVNISAGPVPFLWAWHALFSWRRGDRICLARSVKECRTPEGETVPWPQNKAGNDLSRAHFAKGAVPAAKVFAGPLSNGRARIQAATGATLDLTWPAGLFPYAGIWITRGFWNGLHHWAIEPTNAPVDRLNEIKPSPAPSVTMLAPREVREWCLRVGLARVRQS